jgi:hypothetical protein
MVEARAYDGGARVLELLAELRRVCERARRQSDRTLPEPPRAELICYAGRVTVLVRCRALPLWDESGGPDGPTTREDEHALRYDATEDALEQLPGRLSDELDRARRQLREM